MNIVRQFVALYLATGVVTAWYVTPAHAILYRTVALSGQSAPDVANGASISRFFDDGPVINNAGQTAFAAVITGTGVDGTNDRGIWSERSAGLGLVARTGAIAPGTGVNFGNPPFLISGFSNPALNIHGNTAFLGGLSGESVNAANDVGIWVERNGYLSLVARKGSAAPGTASGVNFFYLSSPLHNDSGQTAFLAELQGPGIDPAEPFGIFAEAAAGLRLVTHAGLAAPGTAGGITFSNFGYAAPQFNGAGQTAFLGFVEGNGVNESNDSGIWSEAGGNLDIVARENTSAAGTDVGVNFSRFGQPDFNDAGETAFLAYVTGTAVDSSNNFGIWSEGRGGLHLVSRAGSVAPGTDDGVYFDVFPQFLLGFDPVINNEGDVAFLAPLRGAEVDNLNNTGIWLERDGSLQLIARSGALAPGTEPGVTFRHFGPPILNDASQIAFLANIVGVGTDAIPAAELSSIWANGPMGLTLVAREGDTIEVAPGDVRRIIGGPDDPNNPFAGVHFFGSSAFNSRGQLAFIAWFTDGSSGIFVADIGTVPEPASAALTVVAVALACLLRRRKR